MEIYKKIIELRQRTGWSQSELSRKIGITSSAVSQIEKGNRMPSLIVTMNLAKAFNISVSDLIDELTPCSNQQQEIFFRKFGEIKNLNEDDQKILLSLIKRLNK